MKTAFVEGKLIDGTGAAPLSECSLVIEGSKIVEISQQKEFGPEVQVINVSGKTIMPGLIDTHMHFSTWAQWLITKQAFSLMNLASQTVYHLKASLEAGCTTARDLGGLEVGFCEAQAQGLIPGPRLQTALVIIQATNGVTDIMPGVGGTITPQGLSAFLPGVPTPWCDGVDQVRAKVREVLRYGAHVIKIANTAVPWVKPHLRPDRPLFTIAELEAAVDEAHRAGVQVCCHTIGFTSVEATLDAIRAGVDIIDHGTLLDEECVNEMAKRGTWLCPMFTIIDFHMHKNPNPYVNKIAKILFENAKKSFDLALKAGVRICMGTDAGFATGIHGIELKYMVDAGMTPMQSIVASTSLAAEAMTMQNLVGTLEIGKEADLIVVDGDPLEKINLLSEPKNFSLVMQAGKPISGPLVAEFPWQPPPPPIYFIK